MSDTKPPIVKFQFVGFEPVLRPLSTAQGGGMVISISVSENEWEAVKEVNNPQNKELEFTVTLEGYRTK